MDMGRDGAVRMLELSFGWFKNTHTHHYNRKMRKNLFFKDTTPHFWISWVHLSPSKTIKIINHDFPFDVLFFILPYVLPTCSHIKYSHCTINICVPLLRMRFNITNVNIFSTLNMYHLSTSTLPPGTGKIMYPHSFNNTNNFRPCPVVLPLYILSLSLYHIRSE